VKICFLMWDTIRTGGVRCIFEVANHLAARGNDVRLIALGGRNHDWFQFRDEIKIHYPESRFGNFIRFDGWRRSIPDGLGFALRKVGIPFDFDRTRVLSEAIPRDSDAVIATFSFTSFAAFRAGLRNAKLFYYIQHFEPLLFADVYRQCISRESYFLPLRWIVSSSWVNQLLADEVGKTGTVVLPGTDLGGFRQPRSRPSGPGHTVIALGKSAPIKGLKYLFEALSLAKMSVPNLRLLLYGGEPGIASESPVPTTYIESPTDSKLAELYSFSDVAVTSSLYESSPSPPIEAMACGVPVVTTVYGTEDFCFHERNALVVPPRDSMALASAMVDVLTDPSRAARLAEAGLKTVQSMTWAATAERVESVLRLSG